VEVHAHVALGKEEYDNIESFNRYLNFLYLNVRASHMN